MRDQQGRRLSVEEQRVLLVRAQSGDRAARDTLVELNQGLVKKEAARAFYAGVGGDQEYEDLVQWGQFGLLRAIEKWDSKLGFRFSTYAVPWIRAYVHRYGQIRGHSFQLSYRDTETINAIRRARADLMQHMPEDPTAEQIAEITGVPIEFVERILQEVIAGKVSLDKKAHRNKLFEMGVELYEIITDPDEEPLSETTERALIVQELHEYIDQLPDLENEVIRRRFLIDPPETCKQIGDRLGYSHERIRQIEKSVLLRMRIQFARQP